jgi:hypothetical protein
MQVGPWNAPEHNSGVSVEIDLTTAGRCLAGTLQRTE